MEYIRYNFGNAIETDRMMTFDEYLKDIAPIPIECPLCFDYIYAEKIITKDGYYYKAKCEYDKLVWQSPLRLLNTKPKEVQSQILKEEGSILANIRNALSGWIAKFLS